MLLNIEIEKDPEYLYDYNDGEIFKSKIATNNAHKFNIKIEVHGDDIKVAQKSCLSYNRHKILCIFFTINNLNYTNRSKRKDIYLTIICRRDFVNLIGLDEVLAPLIDDINYLNINGIDIELLDEQRSINYKCELTILIADNLMAHEMCGVRLVFNSGHICRFCYATYKEIQENFEINHFIKRTKENFNEDLANLKALQECSSKVKNVNGVIDNHQFSQMYTEFDIFKVITADPMHDIEEGILPILNVLILTEILSDVIKIDKKGKKIRKLREKDLCKLNEELKEKKINVKAKWPLSKDTLYANADQVC